MPKKTIMIVDDEYLILETVQDILKKAGFNVITALSGDEALKKLKKSKADLALIDVMMPGMGGIELTKKIRMDKNIKNIDIAFLSVLTFSELQKYKLKKYKILDYIQKPFERKELIARINKIIQTTKKVM